MNVRDVVFVHQLKVPHLIRWHSRRHAHEEGEYELHCFLGGEGRFESGDTTWSIGPGSLFLTPPGVVHELHPQTEGRPFSYYAVLFSPDGDTDERVLLSDERFIRSFPRKVGTRHRLMLEEIKNKFAHTAWARRRAADHTLTAFLFDLYADAEEQRKPYEEPFQFSVHLDRAVSLFQKHIADNCKVADVAGAIGISQAHLTRLFTSRFGVTPFQYYRRLRMEVAVSMLLNSMVSVKEIAYELGYANPFHFSRSFHEFTGMSPTTYRNRYYSDNPMQYARRVVPDE